jgi:hypothetical protein
MYSEMGIERERGLSTPFIHVLRDGYSERERFKGAIHSCTQKWLFRERGLRAPLVDILRDGH